MGLLPFSKPAIGALDVACRDSSKFGVSADEGWDYGNDLRRTVLGCGRSKPSRRCWKEFVSLSEQVDTSTPTGKMVFTVLGAVAELERSLIAERVRAGLRNARAKGKTLGRPRRRVDRAKVARLRASGQSWNKISKALGISRGTAERAVQHAPKV